MFWLLLIIVIVLLFPIVRGALDNWSAGDAEAYRREQQAKWERDNAEAIRMARFIAERQREVLAEAAQQERAYREQRALRNPYGV